MDTDLVARHQGAPMDDACVRALAGKGVDLRLVRSEDRGGLERWMDAVGRGFFTDERTAAEYDAGFERSRSRRIVGVFDAAAPVPDVPVATFASWVAELSVPGGTAPACAISAVTVAPTHRRRGIARAMMEGELRVAAEAGIPVAVLTVSESTIYGRYGFAPAAAAANWTIDVPRVSFTGPVPDGRVDFITREQFRALAPDVHDRARLTMPGEIEMPSGHWDRIARTSTEAKDPGKLRAVRYADADQTVRGLAVYSVAENDDDFARSTVDVSYLVAENPDAYAALWRYFLEMDLVGRVRAGELSVDEPLLWMISDQRAAEVTVRDHQYVRILDVAEALELRRFGAPGVLALEVDDALGIAGGRFLLRVDRSGGGEVTPWQGDAPDDAVIVRLGIAELSAAYLGSVSLGTLAAAGRVTATDAAAAARVLSWHTAARLSFWY